MVKYAAFRARCNTTETCNQKGSGDMISDSLSNVLVTHIRTAADIPISLTIDTEEGPDEAFIYSYVDDDVLIGDYLLYDSIYYLTYNKYVIPGLKNIRKYKAVQCNVHLQWNGNSQYAHIISSLRKKMEYNIDEPSSNRNMIINDDKTAFILTKANSLISEKTRFIIGSKTWEVTSVDDITKPGLYYITAIKIPNISTDDLDNNIAKPIQQPDNNLAADEVRPGNKITIPTVDGYFSSDIELQMEYIIANEVRFTVPGGIKEFTALVKTDPNTIISKKYKVV